MIRRNTYDGEKNFTFYLFIMQFLFHIFETSFWQ